jgi:ZIP family zinc transporter
MWAAFGWGAVSSAALLVGALIAYRPAPGPRLVAMVMALGTGLLIGSVSFELIDQALRTRTVLWVGLLVLAGAAVFTAGDWLLQRRAGTASSGPHSSGPGREGAAGAGLAIVLGSVLDGIPESFVLGLTVRDGGVRASPSRWPCRPCEAGTEGGGHGRSGDGGMPHLDMNADCDRFQQQIRANSL